jgi:tetratricopeptide (TPR) repeat protein
MHVHRLIAAGCLLIIAAFGASAQHEEQRTREAAAALYNEGSFAAAADQWASVAAQEPGAVDARINAAQAYLQADDLGHAMLWFRRAQVLDPRHSAVQLGLALVRALRVDILGDKPGILPAVERLSAEVLSRTELAWLTVLSWSAAFCLGTLAYLRQKWRFPAVSATAVACLLMILLIGREISAAVAPDGIITAFETILYSEPGSEGVALARIYAGAEASIVDHREEWTLITLADGRAGWVPEADVEFLAE